MHSIHHPAQWEAEQRIEHHESWPLQDSNLDIGESEFGSYRIYKQVQNLPVEDRNYGNKHEHGYAEPRRFLRPGRT